MRNLKRVLSLALALVMVLGMMVVTTSAADFTDAEEIAYTEAVDVISALGIINGFEAADGTFYFDGDKTLTREQGAKIVCYLLMGKEDADQLVGSGEFTDVAADRWSAGSIDYCAAHGILAGMGDGTFDPEGTLTIVQYAKMLLCALGYDAKVEGYVGSNWATAIVTDMIAASLKVKDVNVDAVLTREIAAQMTLQALEGCTVGYVSKGTDIKLADGTTITIGASPAAKVEGTNEETDPYVELYETLTYATLTKTPVPANENGGLAGYEWKLEGVIDPIYEGTTESVKASYPAGTKFADIIKALGIKNTESKTYDVEVYRNGVWTKGVYSVDADAYFVDMDDATGKTLTEKATAFGAIPNGCSVDVVVTKNADKETVIRLLVNISYLAEIGKNDVTKDEDKDDDDERAVAITASNGIKYTLNAKNCETFEEIFAAASALKKPADKLTYVIVPEGDPADQDEVTELELGNLLSIAAPTVVTGTMTSYNTAKGEYVVDGKTYKVNATATGFTMTDMVGEEANYLLDANGFVLFASLVEEKEADAVYAYVNEMAFVFDEANDTIGSENSAYLQAELIFTDGTVEIVTVASLVKDTNIYVADDEDDKLLYKALTTPTWVGAAQEEYGTIESSFEGGFAAYTVDEDGYYYLTYTANEVTSAGEVDDLAADVVFSDGFAANTKTVFVVETTNAITGKPVYTAYTGYANLPAKTIDTATFVGLSDKGVVTHVFITVATDADGSSADGKTVAFVTGDPTYVYVSKTESYYEYAAIVDGAATTLKVAADDVVAKGGLYTIDVVDVDGYISAASEIAMDQYVSVEAKDSIIKIGADWKIYDENTVVTVIDKGVAKVIDIADLDVNYALYVTYVKDKTNADTNVIDEIIAVPAVVEAASTATELTAALDAAEEGDTIVLTGATYAVITLPADLAADVTINGNGATVAGLTGADVDGLTLKNIKFTEGNANESATPVSVFLKGDSNDVTISGCQFVGDGEDNGSIAIQFVDSTGDLVITGNTFTGFAYPMQVPVASGTVEISENIIADTKDRAIRLGYVGANVVVTINDNTMTDACDGDNEVFKVGRGTEDAVAAGAKITFDGNTYGGEEWDPADITTASVSSIAYTIANGQS